MSDTKTSLVGMYSPVDDNDTRYVVAKITDDTYLVQYLGHPKDLPQGQIPHHKIHTLADIKDWMFLRLCDYPEGYWEGMHEVRWDGSSNVSNIEKPPQQVGVLPPELKARLVIDAINQNGQQGNSQP